MIKRMLIAMVFMFPIAPCAQGMSALAAAAAALAPGESALFPQGLNTIEQNRLNIQWQTVSFYYDSIRKEMQYMGKPASGQSLNHAHFIYDEASSQWRSTGQTLFPGIGHIWTSTFDPSTGDYYYCKAGETYVRHMFREYETWGATRSDAELLKYLGCTTHGAMCWHPNLFGAGQGGIVFLGIAYLSAWRASDNTWHEIQKFSSGTDTWALSSGQGCYLPGQDAAVVTGASSSGHPLLRVGAGSNGSAPATAANLGPTPISIIGGGGTTLCGKMLNNPHDPDRLLIIERSGTDRVWTSDDGGDNWTLQAYKHPLEAAFEAAGSSSFREWTAGTVAPYDVIWGLNSHIPLSILWKPPVPATAAGKGRAPLREQGPVISASPNPFYAGTVISINGEFQAASCKLSIFDVCGKPVQTCNLKLETRNSFSWNASGLPAGIYLARVRTGNKTYTKRIILQK